MTVRTDTPLPDVTVIIVTRNTCALTCAAVQSVFASADGLAKAVVVVDNGSTDGTAAVVRERFPTVRYLFSEVNLGFAGANNRGALGTAGEFILLLNSDARLEPDALGQAVAWMRAHPDCGIGGAHLLNPDGSPQNAIANFPTLATELLNKSLLRRLFPRRYPGKEQHFTEPVAVETVIGAFMLIRRTVWEALGGFDERYFFFFEETDFCLGVRRAGWRILHLPQVRVWHEQGGSAKRVSAAARIEYWRSRYRYFRKNHPALTLGLLATGLGVRLLVSAVTQNLAWGLTFGRNPRCADKARVSNALVGWHLRGCPTGMGLPR